MRKVRTRELYACVEGLCVCVWGGGGGDGREREKMRREVILKILYARGFLIFFLPIPSGAPFPVC